MPKWPLMSQSLTSNRFSRECQAWPALNNTNLSKDHEFLPAMAHWLREAGEVHR
jgi:hypothetical protein